MDDDSNLMLRVKQGDAKAFEMLLNKYEGRLINFVYRIVRNRNEAEDVSQETFFRVYRNAGSYLPAAKFSTYLFRIAYNLSIDSVRKKKPAASKDDPGKDPEKIQPYSDIPDTGSKDPLAETVKEETGTTVRKALLELPGNQAAAIILLLYEDKSYKEIGEIIGVSVPSVESLIFRARQGLRKILAGTRT
jgi:RNA polymerase sigma-70 factor (ECF subfamily)